jgi:hypothetical protein
MILLAAAGLFFAGWVFGAAYTRIKIEASEMRIGAITLLMFALPPLGFWLGYFFAEMVK